MQALLVCAALFLVRLPELADQLHRRCKGNTSQNDVRTGESFAPEVRQRIMARTRNNRRMPVKIIADNVVIISIFFSC